MHGRLQQAVAAIRPVQPPFLPCRVEQAQGQAAETLGGKIELIQVGSSAEETDTFRCAWKLVPVVAARQQFLEPPAGNIPRSDNKVEVADCYHLPLPEIPSGALATCTATTESRKNWDSVFPLAGVLVAS